MTVGSSIQKHRKALGLSQDELGQKLLVSRQTISLWEKDQTVPTIDNLLRLKEVFGVSVDDILGLSQDEAAVVREPKEKYRFNLTRPELNEIYRLQRAAVYKRPVILTLLLIILLLSFILLSYPDVLTGGIAGALIAVIVYHSKAIGVFRKSFNKSAERVCESTYDYRIFEDYMVISISRNDMTVSESVYYFSDIEHIKSSGRWLLISIGGRLYIVRRDELMENSVLYSYMYNNPSKTSESPARGILRTFSIILFIASLLSLLAAIALVGAVSGNNNRFYENMWLFFLMTPVPVSSVICGIVLKHKGYKYKKNIIIGVIMTVMLCIYGCFTFMF